jgi:NAD(P)-dependent dehydrogenase (short-subunit alcohol dehydrogenase family)
MAPRIFFITGTSTGFGSELVKTVLEKGDYVVATARNSSKLSFDGADSSNSLFVDLDVTKPESIEKAFDEALKKFKRIDVVVNNAGYGLGGEFESYTDEQIRTQMEVNFFGLINVTRKAMEVMRDLKTGGRIQQVTSIGGQIGE